MESLLEEMVSRESLSYYPEPSYRHLQYSSYNRASVRAEEEGWFENFDMSHFIRVDNKNGRREFVMLDTEGPGVVVRWWMTFYRAQHGILRIYIDGQTTPLAEGIPGELLSGPLLAPSPLAVSVQEGASLGEAGRDYDHNFYVPIPFARHCKITYECDSLVLLYEREGLKVEEGYYWPDVFYNIGCRIYDKNTRVKSVSMKSLKKARPLFDKTVKLLENKSVEKEFEQSFNEVLMPGDSLVLDFRLEGMAIRHLKVEMKAVDHQQALRSMVVRGIFDGHETLSLPVGDFFGTGYSLKPHHTWMNQRNQKGVMESFWVMPFREYCQIVFVNYGEEEIQLKGLAGGSGYKWTENSMYFGAAWHEYYHIQSRNEQGSPFDLNFIHINGQGVYVGDQVALFNNTYHWWGEGDEKIFVDNEAFPSSFGTGSEDYYGYSFARPEPFSHPFLSQPEGKGNTDWGISVNMRHRSLDAIPFLESIQSNIELWHWKNVTLNFALTSYWYVKPPFNHNIQFDKNSVKLPVARSTKDFKQ
jgi:hypothetical protein